MAILAIHTDCFKLLILAISCKNLSDEYPDTTGGRRSKAIWIVRLRKDCSGAKI